MRYCPKSAIADRVLTAGLSNLTISSHCDGAHGGGRKFSRIRHLRPSAWHGSTKKVCGEWPSFCDQDGGGSGRLTRVVVCHLAQVTAPGERERRRKGSPNHDSRAGVHFSLTCGYFAKKRGRPSIVTTTAKMAVTEALNPTKRRTFAKNQTPRCLLS